MQIINDTETVSVDMSHRILPLFVFLTVGSWSFCFISQSSGSSKTRQVWRVCQGLSWASQNSTAQRGKTVNALEFIEPLQLLQLLLPRAFAHTRHFLWGPCVTLNYRLNELYRTRIREPRFIFFTHRIWSESVSAFQFAGQLCDTVLSDELEARKPQHKVH